MGLIKFYSMKFTFSEILWPVKSLEPIFIVSAHDFARFTLFCYDLVKYHNQILDRGAIYLYCFPYLYNSNFIVPHKICSE